MADKRLVELVDTIVFQLFGRLVARQFVVFGGVPAALKRGAELRRLGIVPTYNRIDEHVDSLKRVEEIVQSLIKLVSHMDHTNRGPIAIKPSSLGMPFGPFVLKSYLERLANAFSGIRLEIEIDAEQRESLTAVQHVLNALSGKLPKGITFRPAFQMHLPDALRRELIDDCRVLDMPVRIVKGSGLYNVGESELDEREVLQRYYETFRHQIAKGRCPKVAIVRDEELADSIAKFAESEHISSRQFMYQFLDGPFGRPLMHKYASLCYGVGCYVTFVDPSAPDAWKPYVRRRIAFGRKLVFGQ